MKKGHEIWYLECKKT